MNLNQINYFVMLAQTEHYTKAADKLSITQPTLSHAISLLEEELGTQLFEKKGRNVVLTKYGRVFLKYASESSSPAMHNEAFAYLGLDYAYLAFEVDGYQIRLIRAGNAAPGSNYIQDIFFIAFP